jgi:hypothetical protein
MLKKKSDAKSFNKAINKHDLDAPHLATELAAATATYLGAAERTQLKMAKTIPGGKEILSAVSSNISSLKGNRHESSGHSNVHITRKRGKHSKQRETA